VFKGGIFFDSYMAYKQHTEQRCKPKLLWVQLLKKILIYLREFKVLKSKQEFVFYHSTTLHFGRKQQSTTIQPFSEASRHNVP